MIEFGKRRGQTTTFLMRRLINWLHLDIDRKPDDLILAQFHAKAISETIQYLAAWAAGNQPFGLEQGSWVAEQVLRSKKALTLWRGPTFAQVQQVWGLIWQVAQLVIKKKMGG